MTAVDSLVMGAMVSAIFLAGVFAGAALAVLVWEADR